MNNKFCRVGIAATFIGFCFAALHFGALWPFADIPTASSNVGFPGVKRTSMSNALNSAFDHKRHLIVVL